MKPIAIFYHTLFFHGVPSQFAEAGFGIVGEQMQILKSSGLLDHASHFLVGINGGEESAEFANLVIPPKAIRVMHGLASRAENLTLVELEKWVPSHPDWYVLYFHAKGVTHVPGSDYYNLCTRWRNCMTRNVIQNWQRCCMDLDAGFESVGCHWLQGVADGTQNIWAGNFWWATSNFLRTVPSIFKRDRIKQSGIAALESRYESEVWIGNGRIPKVRDYADHGLTGCP